MENRKSERQLSPFVNTEAEKNERRKVFIAAKIAYEELGEKTSLVAAFGLKALLQSDAFTTNSLLKSAVLLVVDLLSFELKSMYCSRYYNLHPRRVSTKISWTAATSLGLLLASIAFSLQAGLTVDCYMSMD